MKDIKETIKDNHHIDDCQNLIYFTNFNYTRKKESSNNNQISNTRTLIGKVFLSNPWRMDYYQVNNKQN